MSVDAKTAGRKFHSCQRSSDCVKDEMEFRTLSAPSSSSSCLVRGYWYEWSDQIARYRNSKQSLIAVKACLILNRMTWMSGKTAAVTNIASSYDQYILWWYMMTTLRGCMWMVAISDAYWHSSPNFCQLCFRRFRSSVCLAHFKGSRVALISSPPSMNWMYVAMQCTVSF